MPPGYETIDIEPSRVKTGALAVLGVAVVALGVGLIVLGIWWLGAVVVAVFGFFEVMIVRALLTRHGPQLTLSPGGILDRRTGASKPVPWRTLTYDPDRQERLGEVLLLKSVGKADFTDDPDLASAVGGDPGANSIVLAYSTNDLKISRKELRALVVAYLAADRARR